MVCAMALALPFSLRLCFRCNRFSARRVDAARHIVRSQEKEGIRMSLASLNIVLSAAAELGDVDRAFAIFDDFSVHGIEPNADTYSFLLESLSLSVCPKRRLNDNERRLKDIPGRLDAANAMLSIMEENGVKMCQHCIDSYAQLLCHSGLLDAATEFLFDSLERVEIVGNKTLVIIVKMQAQNGNFEVARRLASNTTEPLLYLENRIREMERQRMYGKADEVEQD